MRLLLKLTIAVEATKEGTAGEESVPNELEIKSEDCTIYAAQVNECDFLSKCRLCSVYFNHFTAWQHSHTKVQLIRRKVELEMQVAMFELML